MEARTAVHRKVKGGGEYDFEKNRTAFSAEAG
jgi:hypothetical protein